MALPLIRFIRSNMFGLRTGPSFPRQRFPWWMQENQIRSLKYWLVWLNLCWNQYYFEEHYGLYLIKGSADFFIKTASLFHFNPSRSLDQIDPQWSWDLIPLSHPFDCFVEYHTYISHFFLFSFLFFPIFPLHFLVQAVTVYDWKKNRWIKNTNKKTGLE